MSRTLLLLAAAAFVFMVIGIIAALLKVTAVLALVGVGGLAIVSVAVWLLVRSSAHGDNETAAG